ncbi:MAG: type II toxin-antitoxin system RelE/ParE family toxin [Bacteroidales bacterium]
MNFSYKQSAYPKYNRIKKKFPLLFRKKLNEIEDKIAINPLIGEEKKIDLKGIRIHKFKLLDQQILLAYQVEEDKKEVIFVAVGGHENFYRDLKNYLK